MFIDEHNEAWSFGANFYGQLGLGNKNIRYVPTKMNINATIKHISCGFNHSIIIDRNNNIWVFGDNNCAQLCLGYY